MGIFSAVAGLFGYHPEEDALNSAKGIINKGYDSATAEYQPYVGAGDNALKQYLNATGQGDSNKGISDFHNSPIYKMLQDSINIGNTGVLANSAGSLNSGNTIRALSDYSGQQANNAFGQYLNPIASTADRGYGARDATARLGVEKAGSMADITNKIGQVQGANSIWSGLDSGLNTLASFAGMGSGGGFSGGGGPSSFGSSLFGGGTNKFSGFTNTLRGYGGMSNSLY